MGVGLRMVLEFAVVVVGAHLTHTVVLNPVLVDVTPALAVPLAPDPVTPFHLLLPGCTAADLTTLGLYVYLGFLVLTVLTYSHLRRDALAEVMAGVGLLQGAERP